MTMTFSRSLMILVAVGVPLTAGGMYALSTKKEKPAYLVCKTQPKPCACCCETPSNEELVLALAETGAAGKSDNLMFGGTPQRNMVNLVDKNIPIDFEIEDGKEKKVLWSAALGNKAYSGPIVAHGRIYINTNNAVPRDPKIEGPKAVLMAFNEADGKFLWQLVHDMMAGPEYKEAEPEGLCSTPTVDGDGIFYTTPACVVVRANPEGKVVWTYDMAKELHVVPFHLANCSPLVVGNHVLVVTGNGVDEDGKVHHPKSPSFIALHKDTGKIVWQSALPGDKIIDGQWSNPTLAVINGKPQVIFPGGDAVLYSLDPEKGDLIWKYDCHPTRGKDENYFIATPVVAGDRLYIGLGVYPTKAAKPKYSHLHCIDLTKTGDISPKSLDAKDPANKGSGLVWTFGGDIQPKPKQGRSINFGNTISTVAVHDGLVYAAEEAGYVHCLDAKTGERYWHEDLKAGVWSSPYYVDGKIFQTVEDGTIFIFAHGKTKKQLATIDGGDSIFSTPVVANGVLYIATRSKLYAIGGKK